MTAETDRSTRQDEWRLLLAAVETLHGRGLTGIRAIPTFAPVGYWRFAVTTAANLRSGVNLPERDEDAVVRVTEAGFPRVGGLTVSARTTVDEVADELLRGLGSPREATYFNDREYCAWFSRMRAHAEEVGAPPTAFGDYQADWRCGDRPIDPPPGWVLG